MRGHSLHDRMIEEVDDRLLRTMTERRATIIISAFTTIGLSFVAVHWASQTWPCYWLPVDVALVAIRFALATLAQRRQGRRFRDAARLCLVAGGTWVLWLGIAIALSLASGNAALCTLAAALAAGVAGGTTSRNAGTPRYATAVIAIILGAFATGLLLSPERGMNVIAVFALPWGLSLVVMLMQNHAVLRRLVRAEKEAKDAARTDSLTGLFNRAYLDEWLSHSAGQDVGILSFDLDDFKTINDTYGHLAGDLVLKEIARRAHSVVRASDTIIRIGGDEFLVLLHGSCGDECAAVARRLIAAVSAPIPISDQCCIRISVSVGSTCSTLTDGLPLNVADLALYRAKAKGKSAHVHVVAA